MNHRSVLQRAPTRDIVQRISGVRRRWVLRLTLELARLRRDEAADGWEAALRVAEGDEAGIDQRGGVMPRGRWSGLAPRGLMKQPMAETLATGEAAGRAAIGVSWIAMKARNPPALEVDVGLEFGCRGPALLAPAGAAKRQQTARLR